MEEFVKGDVVILPFPFSDLSRSKKRPALVVANLQGDDLILAQITSEARFDDYSINLMNDDFKQGNLKLTSMIRPNRLFTADKAIILYKTGALANSKVKEVEQKLVKIFTK
ncbi:MAG: type II toxin-antitoxin system PemK/MazF family toxin [Nanoarchaeota archaeon]|nr:type II toxin-antitoxin system PemK/MazF family toxin [Nanoarchaeota archaeon]